jgi:N4-(beta-N-acetylglucosaminyl)-L-asparaginase
MARGASPQDACMELLKHMVKTDPQNQQAQVAVIAINKRGKIGTACLNEGFQLKYALWRNGESQLLESVRLI